MNTLVKNYIKKIIRESFIVENYPESFDMDFFKRLTNKRKINFEKMITHHFSLDDVNKAIDLVKNGKAGRIMIYP